MRLPVVCPSRGPNGADAEFASVDPAGATGKRSWTASGPTTRIVDETGQSVSGADLLSAFPSDGTEAAELDLPFLVEEAVDLVGERTVADGELSVEFDDVPRPRGPIEPWQSLPRRLQSRKS